MVVDYQVKISQRYLAMKNSKKDGCVLTSVIVTELDILKRHIDVLKTLKDNQPMGIIKLAELTNYPQHMVRYSLRILEQDGLIEPSPQGAITTDAVDQTISELKNSLNKISGMASKLIDTLG
jgi:predicted transcriptional regulator